MTCGDKIIDVIFDTGATCSIINSNAAKLLNKQVIKTLCSNSDLRGAGDNKIQTSGRKHDMEFTIQALKLRGIFIEVQSSESTPPLILIGNDFLRSCGTIKFEYKNDKVTLSIPNKNISVYLNLK